MESLSEKLKRYIDAYQSPPFGMEVQGTVELLQEVAGRLKEYEDLEEQEKKK